MLYTLSYQMYKYEHGLHVSAAERRAADERAGEIAAALHALWLCLGRARRQEQPVRPAREAADPVPAPAQFLSNAR